MNKRTKIVCTIGPASCDKATLKKMIQEGMNVARLNFSHGSYDDHLAVLHNVRDNAKELKTPVAVVQDLQGPRFRIGMVGDGIKINNGEIVALVGEKEIVKFKDATEMKFVPIQSDDLYKSFKPKNLILIEDGLLTLEVVKIIKKQIIARVVHGGVVKTNKGMNFPDADLQLSSLTAKDKLDIVWGIKNKVDFIAFSFVRSAADAVELRQIIKKLESKRSMCDPLCRKCPSGHGKTKTTCTQIIAKIETPQAVEKFDEILEVVDGVMVARGDLGIELSVAKVPLLQKELIKKCNQLGKAVIVATQMLDSMVNNPLPTRAEVSDVANAVLDGTDAIMLSAESAVGKYPVKAVQTLSNVAREIEETLISRRNAEFSLPLHYLKDTVEAVSLGVVRIAQQVKATVIVCATVSGFTPRLIARYKPIMPIIALTNIHKTRAQLALSWGVESYLIPDSFCVTFDLFIDQAVKFLKQQKRIKKGDKIVFAMDHPFDLVGETNVIKVQTIK